MRTCAVLLVLSCSVVGCSGSDAPAGGTGGGTSSGGSGAGGATQTGGSSGAGTSGAASAGGSTGGASATGGAGNTGGASLTGGAGNTGGATGTGGVPVPPGTALTDRIQVKDVTTPAGVKGGVSNWRIWKTEPLAVSPVFTVPKADCGVLVGYTTGNAASPVARVAVLGPDHSLVTTLALHPEREKRELRGLAVEPDGHFAALLWDDAADKIYVRRFDAAGTAGWTEELTNGDNKPDDFGIGESRLEFGSGRYGAYYHVHSDSGHEGDTLKWVNATDGAETTEWGWGCSHSMSNLLRFNTTTSTFLPVCVTDCYPGTNGDFATNAQGGIYLNHNDRKVLDVNAGCNGKVAGEIGGLAPSASDWKLVFNAHQNPMTKGNASYDTSTMNQDIGFSAVTRSNSSPVVWLTTTAGVNETDPTITLFRPEGDAAEQYVVGWAELARPRKFKLARVGPSGSFIEGPVDVTTVKWGERDDPFRTTRNGDVVWSWFDAAGSTTLHVARIAGGSACVP